MTSTRRESEARAPAAAAARNPVSPAMILGRSLFPIIALVLIAGTVIWGPWVTLVLTVIWWRIVATNA